MVSAWQGQQLGQWLAHFQLFLEQKAVPERVPRGCGEEYAIRALAVPRRPWEEGRLCPEGGVNLESGSPGGTGLHVKFPWGKSSLHVLLLGGSLSVVGGGPAYLGRLITSGRFIPEPCNHLCTCLLPPEAVKSPRTETVLSASGLQSLHQEMLTESPQGPRLARDEGSSRERVSLPLWNRRSG